MTYTRKPRQIREVTFEVSWIEEPIKIPAADCLSYQAILEAGKGDPTMIFHELPSEISALLELATGEEVGEFTEKWTQTTERLNRSRERTETLFDRIIRGLS